jgi:hypothetical protein
MTRWLKNCATLIGKAGLLWPARFPQEGEPIIEMFFQELAGKEPLSPST